MTVKNANDMVLYCCCCCCCMDIIKCEYKAITIKWNRCKFNLSNVSIWINIYIYWKQDGNTKPTPRRGRLPCHGWATHWNSKIETRSCTPQERDCPPLYLPLSFSLSLSCVLKFRALGVSFTALPTANWQLAFWDNPILGHVKAEVATQDIF